MEAKPAQECGDLLYRFTVISTHPSSIRVKISFRPKCDEESIDLIWPRGGVKDFVKAGSTSQIMTLRRSNPFAQSTNEVNEIEKLETVLEWKAHKDQDFKMERLSTNAREESKTESGKA